MSKKNNSFFKKLNSFKNNIALILEDNKLITYNEVKKFDDMNKRTLKEIIRRSDSYKFFSMIEVKNVNNI